MNTQNTYIFLCNNKTYYECIEKMLFGGGEGYARQAHVKKDDILFLYNYSSEELHGVFTASSDGKFAIDVTAWDKRFPWQVEVTWLRKYPSITLADFTNIIPFHGNKPQAHISPETTKKLYQIFESPYRLPHRITDYRDKNPATLWTKDRHKVRNSYEILIDDWLYEHEIAHAYELYVFGDEELLCDFFITHKHVSLPIVIEYWGGEKPDYKRKKLHKQKLYASLPINLINIEKNEIYHLDSILGQKLRALGVLSPNG